MLRLGLRKYHPLAAIRLMCTYIVHNVASVSWPGINGSFLKTAGLFTLKFISHLSHHSAFVEYHVSIQYGYYNRAD